MTPALELVCEMIVELGKKLEPLLAHPAAIAMVGPVRKDRKHRALTSKRSLGITLIARQKGTITKADVSHLFPDPSLATRYLSGLAASGHLRKIGRGKFAI